MQAQHEGGLGLLHILDQMIVMAVVAVVDIAGPFAQLALPHRPLGSIPIGDRKFDRHLSPDREFQMELARAVLRVLPQGPGHAGQSGQKGAIIGDELLHVSAHSIISEQRQGFRGHFLQNPRQQFRFDHLLHGRKTGQTDRRAVALDLQPLKVTGLTEGAGGFQHGVEQPKEQQRHILSDKEGSARIGFRRSLDAPLQMRSQATLEGLQKLPLPKLGFGQRVWSSGGGLNHTLSKPVRYDSYKLQLCYGRDTIR